MLAIFGNVALPELGLILVLAVILFGKRLPTLQVPSFACVERYGVVWFCPGDAEQAGAIPGGALFAQALEDALGLRGSGVELLEIPLDPQRLWQLAGPGPA